MNYFPHPSPLRPAAVAIAAVKALAPMRQALTRDILWNRPLFKAPALPSPGITVEPLPFPGSRAPFPVRQD